MRDNAVKRIWAAGGSVLNGWCSLPCGFGAEVMAHLGWDSLTVDTNTGGEIIVAVDLTCSNNENFVVQTNSNDDIIYKGCAVREGGYVVIHWNDGAVVSYALSHFRAGRSVITL